MRVMVFFDLPVGTAMERKQYRLFRKFLKKEGYVQLQESVYTKLAINAHSVEYILTRLENNKPPKGLVHALTVTEASFAAMRVVVGDGGQHFELTDTESMVVL